MVERERRGAVWTRFLGDRVERVGCRVRGERRDGRRSGALDELVQVRVEEYERPHRELGLVQSSQRAWVEFGVRRWGVQS